MTNFIVYDPDAGRINQSNKVYDTQDYAGVLNDHNLRFVALDKEGFLSPQQYWVKDRVVTERKLMPIKVDRTRIKAGSTEAAVFTGIPKNATVSVWLGNLELGRDVVPTGSIDLPIPVPCTYRVKVELWPWMDFEVSIEAA